MREVMIFPSLVTRSGLDFSEFHHHTQNTVDFVKQHCKDHCKVLPTLKGGSCTARANPTHHEEFTAGVSMSRMQLGTKGETHNISNDATTKILNPNTYPVVTEIRRKAKQASLNTPKIYFSPQKSVFYIF